MRKALVWVLVLGALGAAGFGLIRLQQQRSAADVAYEILRSDEAQVADLAISVTASGNVAVSERTELLTEVPGIIAEVPVEVNERVEAGQVLALLDTDDLLRTLRQTQIALELAEINLETAQETADAEDIRVAELTLSSAGKAVEVARLGLETARVDADAIRVQAQRAREQAFIVLRDARDKNSGVDDARIAYAEAEAEERAAELNATATQQQADAQYQAAQTSYEQAQRALDALLEGPDADVIRQQELQVEKAQLQLEQIERRLADAALTAPHDGIIAAINIEPDTYQSAGRQAFTLVDDSRTYVDVTIDEIDIGAIDIGQTVDVVLDAYPDVTLNGTVETIAPASTNIGGLVAYRVRVELAESADSAESAESADSGESGGVRVMEGMTASVRIATETIPNVLRVPTWALRTDTESAEVYTYIVEGETPVRQAVTTGRRNETFTEILSGVAAGDTVALVLEERVPVNIFAAGGPPSN